MDPERRREEGRHLDSEDAPGWKFEDGEGEGMMGDSFDTNCRYCGERITMVEDEGGWHPDDHSCGDSGGGYSAPMSVEGDWFAVTCKHCKEPIILRLEGGKWSPCEKTDWGFAPHQCSVTKAKYRDFLKSEEWRRFRAKHIEKRCRRCGSKRKLQLHHVDYKKGLLNPKNVITLCSVCHSNEPSSLKARHLDDW